MTGLRPLIVSSRYWPLVSEPERYIAELAISLRRSRLQPTILTARWCSSWPTRVTHQQVPVVRLAAAPAGGWATYRYLREMSRWLRQHQHEFDVALVGNLRQEAYAVIGAVGSCPVVVSPESLGGQGDCRWHAASRIGRRVHRRCQRAAAFVAGCSQAKQELLEAGYRESDIVEIAAGAAISTDRSPESQHRARQALVTANHDLEIADFAPLVLCVERMEADRGLAELLTAWRFVGRRFPSAKLWIVGDGPHRQAAYEQVVDLELHRQVYLPGSFDDLSELFQAADICVAPGTAMQTRTATLPAMAAGLPVVAVATPTNRAMIDAGNEGLLVPTGSSQELGVAICQLLESAEQRTRLGHAARQRVAADFSLSHTTGQFVELFSRLVADRH